MATELAKQLKDAGFPQGLPDDQRHYSAEAPTVEKDGFVEVHVGSYVPTLSELIEACPNSLFGIMRAKGGSRSGSYCLFNYSLFDKTILKQEGEWETPEYAVAKLWLVLHKN